MALYNILASIREKLTVEIIGLAASMGSVIALSGKEKPVIHEGAFFMIHDPFAVSWGTSEELRRDADTLDKMTASIVRIYQDASGLPEAELRSMMKNETWLSAEEAVEKGFASEVKQGVKAAACASLRKYGFANVPECLQKSISSIRDFENALRDELGFSNRESKLIASHGFTALHRDDEGLEEIAEALKSTSTLTEELTMETNEIATLIEKQGEAFKAFQARHEERMAALEARLDTPKPRTLSAESKANGPVFYDKAGNILPSFKASDPWPIEGESLSVGRTFRGILTGNWTGAEKEFKAVSGTTGGAGGYLLPAPVASQIIEAVRNRLSIMATGIPTVQMADRELTLARVITSPTAAVYDEEATIDEASVTFGAVKLEAKKYACIVPCLP
jgi:hypothetical protein